MNTFLKYALLLLMAACLMPQNADAQLLKKMKERAERRAQQKIENRANRAVDNAVDGAEDAIEGAIVGEAPAAGGGQAAAQKPGNRAWANYDFVPGHRVLAYHDFQNTYVGNFPSHLTYMQGNMEVVEFDDGNRALRTDSEGRFTLPLPETLPQKFTIEFRVSADNYRSKVVMFSGEDRASGVSKFPQGQVAAVVSSTATGLTTNQYQPGPKATDAIGRDAMVGQWVNIRIAVDGDYWKMYANEKRVANVPQVTLFPRGNALVFYYQIYKENGDSIYLDDFRIAEGGRSILYEELQANGKIVTQGILFDVNSDRIRPESTPTLMDIARMMKQHGDLRLRIEGHTDNTGSDSINAPLSQRRAEAVVEWLAKEQNIDRGRFQAEGFGAGRPVSPNTTPEGRQENRRVELHPF
ncbi:MAG: hypothetical protein RhofKO_18830 [Rhodothermales bacterium]